MKETSSQNDSSSILTTIQLLMIAAGMVIAYIFGINIFGALVLGVTVMGALTLVFTIAK